MTLDSPSSVELHMCVEEAHDWRSGGVPSLDPGADQALALRVSHDLHQARVALVNILVQIELQLHWRKNKNVKRIYRV